MLLVYVTEETWATMGDQQRGEMLREYKSFAQDLASSGHMLDGAPLQPTPTATTIRMKDARIETTSGPAERTRQQLGGYFLVEAKDAEEAISIAARVPSLRIGTSMEVRPLRAV
jgi:hypothetical protein